MRTRGPTRAGEAAKPGPAPRGQDIPLPNIAGPRARPSVIAGAPVGPVGPVADSFPGERTDPFGRERVQYSPEPLRGKRASRQHRDHLCRTFQLPQCTSSTPRCPLASFFCSGARGAGLVLAAKLRRNYTQKRYFVPVSPGLGPGHAYALPDGTERPAGLPATAQPHALGDPARWTTFVSGGLSTEGRPMP